MSNTARCQFPPRLGGYPHLERGWGSAWGYATLTTRVEKGGGQEPVKGEATLKRGENREGVPIVLSRIPQAQLQRCCRGQKRFGKIPKEENDCWINRPQFATFSPPPGEDDL